MEISTAGITLSGLLHEMSIFPGEIEGLLFGNITSRKTNNMSDFGNSSLQIEYTYYITDFDFIGTTGSFYDPKTGIINKNKLKEVQSNHAHQMLGWFRFRRNTMLKPSLREMSIHKRLETAREEMFLETQLNNNNNNNEDEIKNKNNRITNLIFALFTQNFNDKHSILTFDYKFIQIINNNIISRSLSIRNLVSSSHIEYNNFYPMAESTNEHPLLLSSCQTLKSSFHKLAETVPPPHIKELESFHNQSVVKLKEMAVEIESSTTEIKKLQSEIESLTMQLHEIKKKKKYKSQVIHV
eukprot:TRINITY_DN295_c1_g2_i1.p1 TRINITY_DN295_c1_g2~~TRINITY_DN295_c1_g2_i1.p1  ORF type:complete len:297 (-),score=54.87 TRINITY_DN295_c1_g2_i1:60-950(-)